jgi:predicted transcriptional regulator of viral defense system
VNDKGPDWPGLFEVASGQAGYFTVVQGREHGFSSALIAHHLRGGRLLRVGPRLYRFRMYPSSPREEVMQAWLASGPGAVVSHESALDILGLSDAIPDRIHLTVPRSARWLRARPGVVVHTVREPPRPEDVVMRGGLKVTSPTRTILDFAQAGGAPDQVVQAVQDAVQRGMAGRRELLDGGSGRGKGVRDLIEAALATGES